MVSMEIRRSKVAANKLWRIVRLAFLLIKKGLISKRKLIMDLNLSLKKSSRLIFRKPPPMSRLFVYHRTSDLSPRHGRDYEFSCSSNSPDPVFSRVASKIRKNYHFSCLASPYSSSSSSSSSVLDADHQNAVVLLPTDQYDAFSYCLSGEEDEEEGGDPRVDDDAEEFINRFYEQLRSQNTPHLLRY